MSWPEAEAEPILKKLSEIELAISEMRPGVWCDEECSRALHEVASKARQAGLVVRTKANMKTHSIRPEDL